MITNIFVNLPVKDLEKTKEFFTKIGFTFNAQFTDDKAAALVIGKNIYAMLLSEAFFKTFTEKSVIDSKKNIEAINALSVESIEEVNELVDKALQAGAKEGQKQELGFMYSRAFEDLDGHNWEILWMDPKHIQ